MPLRENYRENIVTELYRTLHGPYYGKYEIMPQCRNPQVLYLTGVLAPIDGKWEFDSEEDLKNERDKGEDDSVVLDDVNDPLTFVTALDSKSRPQSLGISFLVKTEEETPKFEICITWARYLWCNEWKKIRDFYKREGIEISGPSPEICQVIDEFDDVEEDIETDEDDDIIIEIEGLSDNNIIKPFIETHQQIKEEEKSKDPSSMGAWYRDPRYLILENINLNPKNDFYHFKKKEIESSQSFKILKKKYDEEYFQIYFRITKIQSNNTFSIYRISLYFINQMPRLSAEEEKDEKDEEEKDEKDEDDKVFDGRWIESYIFQPQIRVKLNKGNELVPYEFDFDEKINDDIKWGSENYEYFNSKMLYRNKKPYARGHMCSAVWDKVDPEKRLIRSKIELQNIFGDEIPKEWEILNNENYVRKESFNFPPFYWLDGTIISDDSQYKKFSVPDIRTEYLPLYPIYAPNFTWRIFSNSQETNFLYPGLLAENCWDPKRIDDFFNPMIESYKNWINDQRNKISDIEEFRPLAVINLGLHEEIYNRIEMGLKILKENINARMAFCFANKAIIFQYELEGTADDFKWRPFQIAFLLISIKGIVESASVKEFAFESDLERDLVDLIWIPTGGGKTEAYLLLAAFTISYRRRMGVIRDLKEGTHLQLGVNIFSRYTLRLLTIQQFRRGLKFIMSCELMRLSGINNNYDKNQILGWLPSDLECLRNEESDKTKGLIISEHPELKKFVLSRWIWGGSKFSTGLWIGGSMTPNRLRPIMLQGLYLPGAIDALKVYSIGTDGKEWSNVREGDPAQVIQCPICGTYLSLPKKMKQILPNKEIELFLLINTNNNQDEIRIRSVIDKLLSHRVLLSFLRESPITITLIHQYNNDNFIIGLKFDFRGKDIDNKKLRTWWHNIENNTGFSLLAADILNPGYFILSDPDISCKDKDKNIKACEYDFEIRCLNPKCLFFNSFFSERNVVNMKECWTDVNPLFQINEKSYLSQGVPIHAFTVDEQIYRKLPTMLIGTVDKFAQIAYNDAVGTIFGNVEKFHKRHGFARDRVDIYSGVKRVSLNDGNWIFGLHSIPPPEIILQDELHLIEGPLGSYVGIYELAIDYLSSRREEKKYFRPKYIASTATITSGLNQIQSLYTRKTRIFPPPGIIENDSFFQYFNEDLHSLEEYQVGRLYIGLATPGKSSQTTLSRVYGSFLNKAYELKREIDISSTLSESDKIIKLGEIDRFWTLVGYFNTIKELARTRSVCNQDLREWMKQFYGINSRILPVHRNDPVELSSRTDSVILPMYLKNLDTGLVERKKERNDLSSITNILLTTSMFGTGVDIIRLGLMVIDGQPKTTGQYIQTSGRVGRSGGGIVLTFLHAGRPRDLDHYEQFVGYHQAIYRHIEPSTVAPFAPNCLETTIGPISIALLRQALNIKGEIVDLRWRGKRDGPKRIIFEGVNNPRDIELFKKYLKLIEERHSFQPETHKLINNIKKNIIENYYRDIIKWFELIKNEEILWYNQFLNNNTDQDIVSVILGDPQHQFEELEGNISVIFKNAPNSLRGVEPTICLGVPYEKK